MGPLFHVDFDPVVLLICGITVKVILMLMFILISFKIILLSTCTAVNDNNNLQIYTMFISSGCSQLQ